MEKLKKEYREMRKALGTRPFIDKKYTDEERKIMSDISDRIEEIHDRWIDPSGPLTRKVGWERSPYSGNSPSGKSGSSYLKDALNQIEFMEHSHNKLLEKYEDFKKKVSK